VTPGITGPSGPTTGGDGVVPLGGPSGDDGEGIGSACIAATWVSLLGALPRSPLGIRKSGVLGGSGSSGTSTRTGGKPRSCPCGGACGERVNAYTDTPEMIMPRTQTAKVRLVVMVNRKNSHAMDYDEAGDPDTCRVWMRGHCRVIRYSGGDSWH